MREETEIKVLDHGYVKSVEAWGTGFEGVDHGFDEEYPSDYEVGIIEAARMSTGKGFESWEKDERLLKFLYNHKHMTPFEMAGMTIEVAAPIFVFREWHRHRVPFGYNEMSGRYIPLPDVNYVPSKQRLMDGQASTTNKQAQGVSSFVMTDESVREDHVALIHYYNQGQRLYERLLQRGWSKELARLPVPVARYSRMRATGNLRGWLSFLTLRMAPQAQWEIRQYANAVAKIVQKRFPKTYALFVEGG